MPNAVIPGIALPLALLSCAVAMAQNPAGASTDHPAPQGAQLDLEKTFHTRSPWRLVVTEGAPTQDYGGNDAPGALTLCLRNGPACVSGPVTPVLRSTTPDDPNAWEPHYLIAAKVVYPRGANAAPFLLIVTGSLNSGDGDQVVATQLIRYDPQHDEFRRVFEETTGRNNNEEIRFVTDGPLRGSVISDEPQQHLPYGYWIVVKQLTAANAYRQVLRYGSATRYADGNALAVINSEMPNIEQRLGLWGPGEPLPAPRLAGDGKPCLKPILKRTELWCQ